MALANGTMTISKSVTIDAAALGTLTIVGTVYAAGSPDRFFTIAGTAGATEVTLRNMALVDNYFYGGGGAIGLASGALTLEAMTLSNNGAVNGGAIYTAAGTLLTVTDSTISSNSASDSGGGIRAFGDVVLDNSTVADNEADVVGGGLSVSDGDLEVTDSTVTGNVVFGVPAVAGGGIHQAGFGAEVTISGSTISDNRLVGPGRDATLSMGGGLSLFGGTATISDTVIASNLLVYGDRAMGAGLYFGYGTLTMTNTRVTGNSMEGDGATTPFQGGGAMFKASAVNISGSQFDNNSAGLVSTRGEGGGIFQESGTLRLENSVVHDNAASGSGGGLFNYTGTLTIANATVAGNSVGAYNGGGLYADTAQTITVLNSTFHDNQTGSHVEAGNLVLGNSVVTDGISLNIVTASATSLGGNVLTTSPFITTVVTDAEIDGVTVTVDDVIAADLADHGGRLPSVLIAADGPARDGGLLANIPPDAADLDGDGDTAEPVPFDMRGLTRAVDFEDPAQTGVGVDSGALELQPLALVVTTLEDEVYDTGVINAEDGAGLSLREALEIARRSPGADSITFADGLSGTLVLLDSLTIDSDVSIDGDTDGDLRADIAIGGAGRPPIEVTGGTVALTSLTITGGYADYTRGANLRVLNDADLTMTYVSVTDGTSRYRGTGGVYAGDTATLTIRNSFFGNNYGFTGYGGARDLQISGAASATVENTTFQTNAFGNLPQIGVYGTGSLAARHITVLTTGLANGPAILVEAGGTLSLTNSVLETEIAGAGASGATLLGGNLIDGVLSDGGSPTASGIDIADKLFAPADNGGAVDTARLKLTGRAFEFGEALSDLPATDARGAGYARSFGANPDLGAYEAQSLFPVFEGGLSDGSESVMLNENSAAGTAVFDVDANDGANGGTDAGVTYRITAGNLSQDGDGDLPFAIDSASGEITVNDSGDLDFEATARFTLTVEADIGGNSDTASLEVDLVDINDAPVLAGLDAVPAFTEGGAAVLLDADATVSDDDLDALNGGAGNLTGATLTFQRQGGADPDDVFGWSFGLSAPVGLVGNDFIAGGQVIATLQQSGGTATVAFPDANGTIPAAALVNAVLQAVTYANTSTALGQGQTATASIAYGIDDGSGRSNAITTGGVTVTLTGVDNGIVRDGTPGDDTLTGTSDPDTLRGLAGKDVIQGLGGGDLLDGGSGVQDTVSYRLSPAAITIDLSTGTASGGDATGDTIVNFERVQGSNFSDSLTGDGGPNVLRGNGGDDTLSGGGGDDLLFGGDGIDDIAGGPGNDFVVGGAGGDMLDGGDGTGDNVGYKQSSAGVTIDLSTGTASGGDATGDTIVNFERVQGSNFSDSLTGDGGPNVLRGDGGDDTLAGGGGNDLLFGGDGIDLIIGSSGRDILRGDRGADVFRFLAASDSGLPAPDLIEDFSGLSSEGDRIDLSAFAAAFQGTSFTGAAGDVIANASGGVTVVEVDTDGDLSAEFTLELTGVIALTAGDFVF